MHNYFLFLDEYTKDQDRLEELNYTAFQIAEDWDHTFTLANVDDFDSFAEFSPAV